MTQVIRLAIILFCCAIFNSAFGQKSFANCTAAFLNNKMVVDDYSPQGKCMLAADATGLLTVCTADLSPTSSVAVDKITFKVAIRDQNTQTLVMYSNEDFQQVEVQKLLAKCRKGDHIVLLTLNEQYALPHNEILVL